MSGTNYIVIPEGLSGRGRAMRLSRIFARVLDSLCSGIKAGDRVYLAPANRFGGTRTEQEVASHYLESRTSAQLIHFATPEARYLNTRDNARYLRQWLEARGEWPLADPVLVSYDLHLPRGLMIFRQEGFQIAKTKGIRVLPDLSDPVTLRLWYQKYRMVHRLYEAFSYWYFRFHLDRARAPGRKETLSTHYQG